jgi:toxin ParE1/3/4
MKYNVFFISSAEEDLLEIYKYIYIHDSPSMAEKIYSEILKKCSTLRQTPKRGHIPSELTSTGIKEFFEIHYKPYRIIYQVIKNNVYIHCILDGRRNLQDLLTERLLR